MVVVEAAAGYGKTVLAAELVESWQAVGVEVTLDFPGVPAALLVARLRAAAARAGYTEAAAFVEGSADPSEAVERLLAALDKERCAFVIDDAHNAEADAGRLIDHLAGQVAKEQRLVVLARRLPRGAERLRRAEHIHFDAADMALTSDECAMLCRQGFGLEVSDDTLRALERATGGWTAATALAAGRAARTGETVSAVTGTASRVHPTAAVAAILDEALGVLGAGARPLLAQLAHLPLLDAQVVDRAVAHEGFFAQCEVAGLPFMPARDPWCDLPGPVREHLATFSAPDSAVVRRAAHEYSNRGELSSSLQLLLECGEAQEAATLLARVPIEVAETVDVLEMSAVFDQLPEEVVGSHPELLVLVGRALRREATEYRRAAALLERALHLAEETGDDRLARAAAAELASNLLFELKRTEAEDAARAVLGSAGSSEQFTKASAFHTLGFALCLRHDGDGRRDENALAEAEDCFSQAANLYRALRARSPFATLAVAWAMALEFPEGRARAAMHRLDEAADMVVGRPRRWAYIMVFRAWLAADLGLDEISRESAGEALRLGEQLRSDLLLAHGHWKLATLASYSGDAERTLQHLHEAESHKGAWWVPASADFLSEAADALDRVGHTSLAWQYLARAKADPKDAVHKIELSEAALQARHGDPVRAEELLSEVEEGPLEPRERWRAILLRALASSRCGRDDAAAALAGQAFEEAARLGQPQAPLIREKAVTDQLLGLAAAWGHPAALALQGSTLPVKLSVLGGFQLTIGGREVVLRPGQEGRLLRFVACKGGRLQAEKAIEVLWPEAGRSTGRSRLRTLLSRLRASAGDILVRDGEMLALGPSVRVDLDELISEAARARALAASDLGLAATIARGAIVRYRGEALPEDLYEDWAEGPREQARQAVLELLDLCETEAAQRGDLDGVRRIVQRTIELAPYDDDRYLRAASALVRQGRRGEALSVLKRARAAFGDLGLPPPATLLELERSIAWPAIPEVAV